MLKVISLHKKVVILIIKKCFFIGQCIQATANMGQQQQHAAPMHQQQVAQQGQQVQIQTQGGQVLAAAAQSGSTTITTMSPLQQSQQTAHPQQVRTGLILMKLN